MSFTLIMTLILIQTGRGTPITVQETRIENIQYEELCTAAARRYVADRTSVPAATERHEDWEAPESTPDADEPVAERHQLMTPIATCLRVR